MSRQFKLIAAIVVVLSAVGFMGSADAHIGRGGGGIRIGGGGLIPRARGNANGNGNRNVPPPVAQPAPKPAPAPPVVQNSTKSTTKPAVASSTTNKPNTGNVTTNNKAAIKSDAPKAVSEKVQSANVQAAVEAPAPTKTPANPPAKTNVVKAGHLVFSLTGDLAPEEDPNPASAAKQTGLSLEAKQALEALKADAAAAESVPADAVKEVAVKELPLPQIPVGATVTLQGKDLSDKEGQVVLQIGEIALPATITEWKNDKVTCRLPVLGLTKASKATLHVLKADGKTASTLNCELVTPLPNAVDANR